MTNKNCLEGMSCPECGHKDCFVIRATCTVEVTDDGIMDERGFEWDRDSECQCSSCGHASIVGAFSISSIEDTLKQKFLKLVPMSPEGCSDRIAMLLEKLTVEQLREVCSESEIEDEDDDDEKDY